MGFAFFQCLYCRAGATLSHENAVRQENDAAGYVCTACGTRYVGGNGVPLLVNDWPAQSKVLDEARAVNPAWYVEEQPLEISSPWRYHLRKRRSYVQEVIRRHLAVHGMERVPRLLDLGCGDGTNLVWLKDLTDDLYGSDYNMVRLARARFRIPEATLFLADILDYPCVDGFFDVVFFNHVIEHIPRDVDALKTVARILRPGGLLVLGTPNEGCWWWQLAYNRAPDVRATTDHVNFYTARTIREKVASCGLRVTHVEHLGWGPPDFNLDMKWRGSKFLDDLFEVIGRTVLRSQSSSLYVLAERPQNV